MIDKSEHKYDFKQKHHHLLVVGRIFNIAIQEISNNPLNNSISFHEDTQEFHSSLTVESLNAIVEVVNLLSLWAN